MQTTTTYPTNPTVTAIDAAIRNAARSDRKVMPSKSHPTLWFLVNPANARDYWTVDTINGTCDCPAFAREGVCKHQLLVDDEIAVREAEEGMDAAEADEASRCPRCGDDYLTPVTPICDRCEKRALI